MWVGLYASQHGVWLMHGFVCGTRKSIFLLSWCDAVKPDHPRHPNPPYEHQPLYLHWLYCLYRSVAGYSWQLANCVATSGYALYLSRVMERVSVYTGQLHGLQWAGTCAAGC